MTELDKAVMQQALDDLVESARLLGTTQAAKLCGTYSQIDSIYQHACYEIIDAKKQIILAAIAQPEQTATKLDPNKVQSCRVSPSGYANSQPCDCPVATCSLYRGGLVPPKDKP